MMQKSLFAFLLLVFCSCSQYGQLHKVANLPRGVNECSGMVTLSPGSFWVVEDSGNPDVIREVDTLGRLLREFEVKDAKNRDWEALTHGPEGRLYVGDIGNNANTRKDLKIYLLPDPRMEKGDKIPSQTIRFAYPDQQAFPPSKDQRNFDAEAMVHSNGYLYLFTKNRAEPFPGTTHVYRLPDQPGTYLAQRVATLQTCSQRGACQVTDAALSPDGSCLVMLGYGTLWVLEGFGETGFNGPIRQIDLGTRAQLESICFASDTLLYLADEKNGGHGGNLYRYPLPRTRK
ncbi:hypothetical protein OZ410_05725 [Robiginitalea sp. M366]|uniref:hypothetical protein n=1 Tax=Robiginitalea aestuariiviva TaxID=3036903 RepID=UPI00240DFDA5|nr:hypothetical protein [Robiginitalea aestuariiviva]MDG1571806.1 hypothetical protein [Robiginitalea aestuariiviva]